MPKWPQLWRLSHGRGLEMCVGSVGGVFNWTRPINDHKSSLGPHVRDSGISHFISRGRSVMLPATCFPNGGWRRHSGAFKLELSGSERPRRLKMLSPSFCIEPNYLFKCCSARARLPECKSKLLMLCARVPCSGGIICTPSGSAEKTFKHSCLKVLHDQQSIQKLCRPIMK